MPTTTVTVESPCRLVLDCPEGVPAPASSSIELLKYLFTVRGKTVLDLGCGAGLSAIAAALLGASEVWAVDADPRAVDAARRNAARNGAELVAKAGDLFDVVEGRTFDLIIATPPQIPAPAAARGPLLAGPDGLRVFETIVDRAPEYLERGGQLLTHLVSLADTTRFEELLSKRFRFRALPTSRREFAREDYDALSPGLFDYLSGRRAEGRSAFSEDGGKLFATVRSYLAMRL